jgi:nitrite reductase/ring-hydroxylating ferredoxin subunit
MTRQRPIPNSWYFLVPSRKLKAGGVQTIRLADQDLLVFRTEAGHARAAWNICPHLGGRLGDGGRVVGELFECPIHHRRFESSAEATPGCRFGSEQLASIPVLEHNGMVFGWYHAEGEAPTWQPPQVENEGWTTPVFRTLEFETNPEVVMQDLADIEHFTTIHKYASVTTKDAMHAEGHELHVAYDMVRKLGVVPIPTNFRSVVAGLGYQRTDVLTFRDNLHTRHYVMPVPVSPTRIRLTLGLALRIGDKPSPRYPRGIHPMAWAMKPVILDGFVKDIHMDAWAWIRRYQVADLAVHESPELKLYHEWIKQFYSQPAPDAIEGAA